MTPYNLLSLQLFPRLTNMSSVLVTCVDSADSFVRNSSLVPGDDSIDKSHLCITGVDIAWPII